MIRDANLAAVVESPIGRLAIYTCDLRLVGIKFHATHTLQPPTDAVSDMTLEQLVKYFADSSFDFKLPILLSGTPFQQSVWRLLREIPLGEAWSYGELAQKVGTHPRAIGQACRQNPIPIIFPCHRVVAKSGLGGFAGHRSGRHIDTKEYLLNHEGYAH